jgi:hypothetical protein
MRFTSHALAALELLPTDPEKLSREDLEVLLAAISGQKRLLVDYRDGLMAALAAGDRIAVLQALAEETDIDAATQLLRPYRAAADRQSCRVSAAAENTRSQQGATTKKKGSHQ